MPSRAEAEQGLLPPGPSRSGVPRSAQAPAPPSSLGDPRRRILALLCDTLVPGLEVKGDADGFFARRATDLGIEDDALRIVDRYLTVGPRRDFNRLLRVVENRWLNLLLTGHPVRFSSLDPPAREAYLQGWSHSALGVRRKAFHALKRLVVFLYYAQAAAGRPNPNWPRISYEGPDARGMTPHPYPGEVDLDPLVPTAEVTLEADVCVVGSGAGGGVVAAKLSQAGHRVLVVEAGPHRTAKDFSQLEAESYEHIFQGNGVLTTEDMAIGVLAGGTAGGSTTVNWMTCLRTPPWIRREWEEVHGMEGLGGPSFDAHLDEVWHRLNVTTDESQVNPSNDVLRRGSEALGYHFGDDYEVITRNARGCQERCHYCFYGCIYNAKQSTLVTYLPDAKRAGARFLFDCRVDAVAIQGDRAVGVEAIHRSAGREVPVHVRARAVVLAGSAIQTPAILWRSGVRSRALGRGLRLHPNTGIVSLHKDPVDMWRGPMQTIVVRKFQAAMEDHHGPVIETVPGHPGLAALALPWASGRAHKEAMLRFPYLAPSVIFVRDVAEGRVLVDAKGEPVLDYHLTRRDRESITLGLREAARIHRAAGAHQVFSLHVQGCTVGDGRGPIPEADFQEFLERLTRLGIRENSLAMFSAHPMGSARAGRDPATSTSDPRGQVHGISNLWVADGSLFPSAPGVNPMITIMALAVRTSGYIHESLRGSP